MLAALLVVLIGQADDGFRPVPLQSSITHVQPMTGLVLWMTNGRTKTDTIQLEFAYVGYDEVVNREGVYDWSAIEKRLSAVASRGHQAILRFHDTYVGRPTTVPASIKARADYKETTGLSEGKQTSFPDWSNAAWKHLVLDFYTQFARKYDRDPRLAFLETGFGLWAEYHIYEGPMKLGKTFPDKDFQAEFAFHLSKQFKHTPWMISVDAADASRSPFPDRPELLKLTFGVFDDSFNHKDHGQYNTDCWRGMGLDRWKTGPGGGEFSFYVKRDQTHALDPQGPHGVSFDTMAARFHITFMIADAQPRYQKPERIKSAGMACGYRFRVLAFEANATQSRVTVTNEGVAPLYHDAFLTVNGVRAAESLKGLLPGEKRVITIASGGERPRLTIESDRLVPGQRIEFAADLR